MSRNNITILIDPKVYYVIVFPISLLHCLLEEPIRVLVFPFRLSPLFFQPVNDTKQCKKEEKDSEIDMKQINNQNKRNEEALPEGLAARILHNTVFPNLGRFNV